MNDAHHEVGKYLCARFECSRVSVVDTEMGAMCAEHSNPLLFQIQRPFPRVPNDQAPQFVPWEFMRPHDKQAQFNHGGQTLARLAERGGLTVKEALAILQGRDWDYAIDVMDREVAVDQLLALLEAWGKSRPPV